MTVVKCASCVRMMTKLGCAWRTATFKQEFAIKRPTACHGRCGENVGGRESGGAQRLFCAGSARVEIAPRPVVKTS